MHLRFALIGIILFHSQVLWSQSLLSSTPLPLPEEDLNFSVFFDALATESRLQRPQNPRNTQVRELSLGVNYRIQKELHAFVEASAERFESESEFFVSQAYLTLDYIDHYFSIQAGQVFYPVGWLNENDNYFLNQPLYYETLFKGQKGIDLGVIARYHPLKDHRLIFELSTFAGQVFRASDQRLESPKERPSALSLTWRNESLQTYLTHFRYDLAFYDAVSASGVGLQWHSNHQDSLINFGFWGEYWHIQSRQEQGPETQTQGGFAYPHFDFWRLRFGYRSALSTTTANFATSGEVQSQVGDRLLRAEFQILPPLRIVFEDLKASQKNGIDIRDEWAIRLLFQK